MHDMTETVPTLILHLIQKASFTGLHCLLSVEKSELGPLDLFPELLAHHTEHQR